MTDTMIMILAAVAAVGLFVVGMSLTLMIKGHHIKSEIADNENMKALGIKCAAQQFIDEERELRGEECGLPADCNPAGCAACVTESK